jgi:DNA-binding transcriptional LysR family regulator
MRPARRGPGARWGPAAWARLGLGMTFRFDLVDLRLFSQVVEAGSITAGAEASRMALAAASARLLAMENTLGATLLLRANRGVQITPVGRALLQHARGVLQQMERLNGDFSPYASRIKAQVQLWCNTVAMQEYIPDLLGDYLVAHPHVNVHLREHPGAEVVGALTEGAADIGIVREGTDVFELETFSLQPDRLVMVTPRGHPLAMAAEAGPIDLAEADGHAVVGLRRGIALQDIWDVRVAQRGRRLNYRVRVSSFDAQCRLVACGAGIAVMPQSSARRHARLLDIALVPLTEVFSVLALRLCVRRMAELPAHARNLVDALLRPVPDVPDVAETGS